ncbi:hypothetical protein GCM10020220_091500 [Nonomuraea rubra]|uniref:hypothetical protein n=1 Tax=Nonomuraea rubra TaxID=46180 RepID=UPI0031F19652
MSDGKPITWADYQAQWQALSGRDPAFHIVSSTGYQDIEKVARGKDDHEVVVTFRQGRSVTGRRCSGRCCRPHQQQRAGVQQRDG